MSYFLVTQLALQKCHECLHLHRLPESFLCLIELMPSFEGFVENADAMLGYWRVLLDTSPALLSSEQLIMIMAINMFSIDNTVLKGTCHSS